MESSGKQNLTTTQVQQDIEHFKEQYLHSLGLNLSRTSSLTPSSFLSTLSSLAPLRRDSLSSVGTRRDSLSSSSSQEDSFLVSLSGTREPTRASKTGVIDPSSNTHYAGCTGSEQATFADLTDRDHLKMEYIKSLGLSHRPPRPKGLPCLKDRVSEFETLMAKSAPSIPRETLFPRSKNTSHQSNNYQKSSCTFSSMREGAQNTQTTSEQSFTSCISTAPAGDNCDKCEKFPNRIAEKYDTVTNSVHSEKSSIETVEKLSVIDQRNIPYSSDHFRGSLVASDQSFSKIEIPISSPLNSSPLFHSHPTEGNYTRCEVNAPNKRLRVERALSLESKRDMFEKLSLKQTSHWKSTRNKTPELTSEKPVIHKTYTEKEKSFILESFRKSGGRQQRTLSLGSCVNLPGDTFCDNLISTASQTSRTPCQLSQSMTKIVNRFEDISHCELNGKPWPAHSEDRTSESSDKPMPFVLNPPGGPEEELVVLSGADVAKCERLERTHTMKTHFTSSPERWEGKHQSGDGVFTTGLPENDVITEKEHLNGEEVCDEAVPRSNISIEAENRDDVFGDYSCAVWEENVSNEIGQCVDDNRHASLPSSRSSDPITTYFHNDAEISVQPDVSLNSFDGSLCQTSMCMNSMSVSKVFEDKFGDPSLSVDVAYGNYRDDPVRIFKYEYMDPSGLELFPTKTDNSVFTESSELLDVRSNVSFDIPLSVNSPADIRNLSYGKHSPIDILKYDVIDTKKTRSDIEPEIGSYTDTSDRDADDLCTTQDVVCRNLSFSANLEENNCAFVDESGYVKSMSTGGILGELAVSRQQTKHDERNFTETVNRLTDCNQSQRASETSTCQSGMLPACDQGDSEVVLQVVVGSLPSAGDNVDVSINTTNENVQRLANTPQLFREAHDKSANDLYNENNALDRILLEGTDDVDSLVEIFGCTMNNQQVLCADQHTSKLANNSDGVFMFSELQDIISFANIRETAKDMIRESGADMIRETATDMIRETATDVIRESGSDMIRETATDMIRESGADMIRETATDVIRETATDMIRESGTDFEYFNGPTCYENGTSLNDIKSESVICLENNLQPIPSSDPATADLGNYIDVRAAFNFMIGGAINGLLIKHENYSGEDITPVTPESVEKFAGDHLYEEDLHLSCKSHSSDPEVSDLCQQSVLSQLINPELDQPETIRAQSQAAKEFITHGNAREIMASSIENYVTSLVDSALLECVLDMRLFSGRNSNVLTESRPYGAEIYLMEPTASNVLPQIDTRFQQEGKHFSTRGITEFSDVGGAKANISGDINTVSERTCIHDSQHINDSNNNNCMSLCDNYGYHNVCPASVIAARVESNYTELPDGVLDNSRFLGSGHELNNIMEGNVLNTESLENLPVPESVMDCQRGSFSDISESVDSFYSGVSELAESFHSTDDKDVFEESYKGTAHLPYIKYFTTPEAVVCTRIRQGVDGSCDKKEQVTTGNDPLVELSQVQMSDSSSLEEIFEESDHSEVYIHIDDLIYVTQNEDFSLKDPCNCDITNTSCCDRSLKCDIPSSLLQPDGQLLLTTAVTHHAPTSQQEKDYFEDCLDDDLYQNCVFDHFNDVFSDNFSTENTQEHTHHINPEAAENLIMELEEVLQQIEQREMSESLDCTTTGESSIRCCELEVGIQNGVEDMAYFVENVQNNLFQQTIEHNDKETDGVHIIQEYLERDLSDPGYIHDPSNKFWIQDTERNRWLANMPDSEDIHLCETLAEDISSQRARCYKNDDVTACSGNGSPECQTDDHLEYNQDLTKQSSDSEIPITPSVCCDETTIQFTECCPLSVPWSGECDKDILVCDVNCAVRENSAGKKLSHDRSYDSNTESCDDAAESMDRDSLDEDIDNNTEDSVMDAERSNFTASQQPSSSVFPKCPQTQDESPPLSSFSIVPKKEPGLAELDTVKANSPDHFDAVVTSHPMTLGQGPSTVGLQRLQSKIKEKRWKEAEDAAAAKVNANIRSPRKVTAPIHLDLASTDMAEVAHDEILENPSSILHRIPSTGAFQQGQVNGSRLDPYRLLERSQSDASLLKRDLEALATDDDIHLTAAESSSGQNISECNRVYLDLSRAEPFERVELGETAGVMMRTSSGRLLETIPQDEELKTGDLSYVYASHRSFSQESSSSMEDLTFSPKNKSKDSAKYKSCGKIGQDNSITSSKSNLRSSFQIYSHSLKQKVRQLQMGSVPEQLNALTELNVLMEQAWSMPIYGKDLAYELCDILRTESALDIIVSNLASNNRELMKVSARLLEQSLTTSNRRQVADNGLELVVKMTHDARGDCELAQICTGILESLFKTSEDTCARVIKLGGLDTITYWCRCNDRVTLKNCAIALSNLALYGGGENQQEMAKHKVPEWLFPLAFVEDDSVRYYALLAIGVLVSNKEIENAVTSSGTLALVLPFIDSHDPAEFAERDTSHRHGRSPGWLKRLIPVLSSKREEAQALAAFHFVMEAGIKSEQGRKEVLYKIGAVDPLKWLASTPNRVASKLAAQALKIIGEEIPHKLSQQVPLWTCDDVVHWTAQVGFGTYADKFKSCHVDGDLLLRLTEEELRDSLNMSCAITRKRFLRELRDLKISSDYTSCDPSMLGAWLQEVGEDMSQYTYQMLNQGVDRPLLRSLTDLLLVNDCKIVNGIHRMIILSKIEELRTTMSSPSCTRFDSIDGMSSVHNLPKTPIDVFISYRRSNGSQLASLLKVHLQLRGFTVFIDIEKLRAGKFDESLLESVRQAKNFIIVLTQDSLDRCKGDDDKKDWVHREITAAIEAGSNIIPLLDNFRWPPPESLPEDMRSICYFNAVRWIHDYQDACVDKLEKFLRGETNPQQRHPVSTASTNSNNNHTGVATPSPKQTSGFESPNSPPYQRAQGMRKMSSIESPVDSS